MIFLDRYGAEIGRRGIRSDDSYPLDKLPDYFVKAALATEDRRFYDHFGVDVVGTLRALVNNYSGDNGTQGGSSITQQLAKNLFLSNERTLQRKIKEAFLAVWLEWHYSKDEILKLYFDAPIWAAAISARRRHPNSTSARRSPTSRSPKPPCSPACSRRRPITRRMSISPPPAAAPTLVLSISSMPAT